MIDSAPVLSGIVGVDSSGNTVPARLRKLEISGTHELLFLAADVGRCQAFDLGDLGSGQFINWVRFSMESAGESGNADETTLSLQQVCDHIKKAATVGRLELHRVGVDDSLMQSLPTLGYVLKLDDCQFERGCFRQIPVGLESLGVFDAAGFAPSEAELEQLLSQLPS